MAEVQSFLWMECPNCRQQVRYYAEVQEWRSEQSGERCQLEPNARLTDPGHGFWVTTALANTMMLNGIRGVVQALAT